MVELLFLFFSLLLALLPSMIKRRQGHIVAISSVQGKISIPFRSACKYLHTRWGRYLGDLTEGITPHLALQRAGCMQERQGCKLSLVWLSH